MPEVVLSPNEIRELNRLLVDLLKAEPVQFPVGISPIGWERLGQLAIRQGMSGLVYRRLTMDSQAPAIPEEVLSKLSAQSQRIALHNLALYGRLNPVLRALQAEAIPVMVLKGAHLAQGVYGDLALRAMKDADILIRKEDLARAEACLYRLGYQLYSGNEDRAWYAHNHYHYNFFLPDSEIWVELHWGLVLPDSPIQIDMDGLWKRSVSASIAGVEVYLPSPEDLVLYLCVHLIKHDTFHYFGLRALYDIVLVIRRFQDQIDWPSLTRRARQWGARHAVYLTFLLVGKLFEMDLPSCLFEDLSPEQFDPRYLDWAEERIFWEPSTGNGDRSLSVAMSDHFERVLAGDRLVDKLSVLKSTFLPTRRELAERYGLPFPSWQVYAGYPQRWLELAREHLRRSWLLLRGDPQAIQWSQRERQRIVLASWLADA